MDTNKIPYGTLYTVNNGVVSRFSEHEAAAGSAENEIQHSDLPTEEEMAAEIDLIEKRQLQNLRAEERGKLALLKEREEIKKREERKAEFLNARTRAIEDERYRSRMLASLPPPLPLSVNRLIKKVSKEPDLPGNPVSAEPLEMPYLTVTQMHGVVKSADMENKENFLSTEEREEQLWLARNRQARAEERFQTALKKERDQKECTEILKEIENAEQFNRRERAKNASEITNRLPCHYADALHHTQAQAAMTEAVEKEYIKANPKEHAIDDMECYTDELEQNYQRLDSEAASRLTTCVPRFIQDNHDYLLEEETPFLGARHPGGSEDSTEELNVAYIESPPVDTQISDKFSVVIAELERRHSLLQERIEEWRQTEDPPKPDLKNKAVQIKPTTEDKAVETSLPPIDISTARWKRKAPQRTTGAHSTFLPFPTLSTEGINSNGGPTTESWSSTSYWSLPSNYSLPRTCNFCDNPGCNLPLVETDYIPMQKSPHTSETIIDEVRLTEARSNVSEARSNMSEARSNVSEAQLNLSDARSNLSDTVYNQGIHTGETIIDEVGLTEAQLNLSDTVYNPVAVEQNEIQPLSDEQKRSLMSSLIKIVAEKYINADTEPQEEDDANKDDKFVNSRPRNLLSGHDQIEIGDSYEDLGLKSTVQKPEDHRFHQLSTIEELDSALTNDMNFSKRSHVDVNDKALKPDSRLSSSSESSAASLIDAPPSDVATKAKDIVFTIASPEKSKSLPEFPIVSGNLSEFKTPAPNLFQPLKVSTSSSSSGSSSLQHSPWSVLSDAPYASSLKGSATKHKDIDSYFKDLSSIKGSSSSDSSAKTALSFKPMTVHSGGLSGSTLKSDQGGSDDFQPMIPQLGFLSSINIESDQRDSIDFRPMAQHSDISTPEPTIDNAAPQSGQNFEHVVPNSKKFYAENSIDFRPMAQRSDISTSEPTIDNAAPRSGQNFVHVVPNSEKFYAENSINFRPMAQRSDISTPEHVVPINGIGGAKNLQSDQLNRGTPIFDGKSTEKISSGVFEPITPHSNISTLEPLIDTLMLRSGQNSNKSTPQPNKYRGNVPNGNRMVSDTPDYRQILSTTSHSGNQSFQQNLNSSVPASDFNQLTPHSDISTPSNSVRDGPSAEVSQRTAAEIHGGFRAMIPHSNLSSPSFSSSGSDTNKLHSGFEQLTPRSNISSLSSERTVDSRDANRNNEYRKPNSNLSTKALDKIRHPSSRTANDRVSTNSNSSSSSCDFTIPLQSYAKAAPGYGQYKSSKPWASGSSSKDDSSESVASIEQARSNPQSLSPTNFKSSASRIEILSPVENKHALEISSKANESQVLSKSDENKPYLRLSDPLSYDLSYKSLMYGENSEVPIKLTTRGESQRSSCSASSKVSNDAVGPNHELHNVPIHQTCELSVPLEPELDAENGQYYKFPTTPEDPKRLEALMQEKGITDETDLTLINTVLSVKTGSPEKQNPTTSHALNLPRCRAPALQKAVRQYVPPLRSESPSMISFLQHELSCAIEDPAESVDTTSKDRRAIHNKVVENSTPQLNSATPLAKVFPGATSETKQRTRRLWNNLEEVQSKKLAEQKKEQGAKNRERAKQFSQKIALKKREK